MTNPIMGRLETYYDLKKFNDASEDLARANGFRGTDSILRDSDDHPLEFGAASTNAIAHALTSAYLAYDHSTVEAAALGWAREYNSYWFDTNRPAAWDTFKDLYNNQVGRNIANYVRNNNLSREQIQDLVLDALSSGKLIVTQKDKRIDPSFNGDPRNFSLPAGDAAPWTAPSADFSDFSSSVTRVPVAPPKGLKDRTSLPTDTRVGNRDAEPVPLSVQVRSPATPVFQPARFDAGESAPRLVRVNGSPSAALPAPFAGLSDTKNPWDDRFGNRISSPQGIPSRNPNLPAPSPESEGPIGLVSGKPMRFFQAPIFDTRINSGASDDWFTAALLRGSRTSQRSSLEANSPQLPFASDRQNSLSSGDAATPVADGLGSAPPTSAPQNSQGALSLNDAYLPYRKRLDANQSQASAIDTSTPPAPLVPSDDSNFSGGLLGRLTALMAIDAQNPEKVVPPPDDDELSAFYGLPAQAGRPQRWR